MATNPNEEEIWNPPNRLEWKSACKRFVKMWEYKSQGAFDISQETDIKTQTYVSVISEIWNGTNLNDEMCKEVVEYELLKLITVDLASDIFKVGRDNRNINTIFTCLKGYMGILHNTLHRSNLLISLIQQAASNKLVSVLKHYSESR